MTGFMVQCTYAVVHTTLCPGMQAAAAAAAFADVDSDDDDDDGWGSEYIVQGADASRDCNREAGMAKTANGRPLIGDQVHCLHTLAFLCMHAGVRGSCVCCCVLALAQMFGQLSDDACVS